MTGDPPLEALDFGNSSEAISNEYSSSGNPTISTVFTIVRLCLAVFGVLANTVTGVVLTNRKLWSPTSMLLLSLVAYDAVFLLASIPVSFMGVVITIDLETFAVIFGICYPLRFMAQTGSIYTTVTVTIERFLIVLRPLKARGFCTFGKTRRAVLAIFIFSLLFNIPRCFFYQLATSFAPIPSTNFTANGTLGDPATFKYHGALADPPSPDLTTLGGGTDQSYLTAPLSGSQSTSRAALARPGSSRDLAASSKRSLGPSRQLHASSASSLPSSLLLASSPSSPAFSTFPPPPPPPSLSSTAAPGPVQSSTLEAEMRRKDEERAYYTWLYTVVYELYVSGVFFYLLPYTLIPILNLQLLLAIKKRRDETRRISVKNQHQMNSPKPTDMEDGLTMIVLGITVCFFICCLVPAVYNVTQIAEVPPTTDLSTYLLIASDTMLCVNASTDFFFYCLLGRRFRNTFLYLFCTKRYLAKRRSLTSSRYRSRGNDSYYQSV